MDAKIICLALDELVHKQPITPVHVDNTTAVGIVNNSIKRQRSRAMNMHYFWLLCHKSQKILNVSYHPGQENLGDYPTKLNNGAHHLRVRSFYQHMKESPSFLPRAPRPSERKGCVGRTWDPYYEPITEYPSVIPSTHRASRIIGIPMGPVPP